MSGRGLCDELVTRPEESYRLWCVVVCDLETSRMGAPYIYDISRLRFNAPFKRTLEPILVLYVLVIPINMALDDTVKKSTNAYKHLRVSCILTL